MCNTDWILTKHTIIDKIYSLLGSAAQYMQQQTNLYKNELPEVIFNNGPKISRGENYLRLPYIMLDYPRHFGKEETIAIRTFFWWGNFFSITLHLSGICRQQYITVVEEKFSVLKEQGFSICINNDPWVHHFGTANYTALAVLDAENFSAILNRGDFVKIAVQLPLSEWQAAQVFIEEKFAVLLEILKHQAPNR